MNCITVDMYPVLSRNRVWLGSFSLTHYVAGPCSDRLLWLNTHVAWFGVAYVISPPCLHSDSELSEEPLLYVV